MDRLTARNENGEVYFPYCFKNDTCGGFGTPDDCINCEFYSKINNTLAEYEDTGLTADDMRLIDTAYFEQARELSIVKRENEKLKEKIESIRRLYEK